MLQQVQLVVQEVEVQEDITAQVQQALMLEVQEIHLLLHQHKVIMAVTEIALQGILLIDLAAVAVELHQMEQTQIVEVHLLEVQELAII